MNFPGVEFVVAYAILTIVSFVAAIFEKNYRYLCYIIGLTTLAGTIMCAANRHLQSEKLFILSISLPGGVLMIALGLNTIIGYSKCTERVTAECIGYQSGRHRGLQWRFPKFRYRYKGLSYESIGLCSYPPEQLDEIFQHKSVMIYINPKNPARCVDKLRFPAIRSVGIIVIGVFFIALPIIFCILSGTHG